MTPSTEHPLGRELQVFRPLASNISAGYLTAALLVAAGGGLVFEVIRRVWFGDLTSGAVLGVLAGGVLFFGGQRLLADIRNYDQLVLRILEDGLEIETGERLERMPWSSVARIEELTHLDTAVSQQVIESSRRPGAALMLWRHDGWSFRLDPNRIADYPGMREALHDSAVSHGVRWELVHAWDAQSKK